jgi:hypothetical protein
VVLLAACGGAASTRQPPSNEAPGAPAAAFAMKDVSPTAYADDLKAAGLDPMHVPQLNKLPPEQLRKVMPLVAKSLGVKCDACHDFNAGAGAMTPRMKVAEHMWNQFVRIRTFSGGEADRPIFCDSCHHGSLTVLNRSDRPALEKWMHTNFVEALGAGSCKACHGDPPRWRFIEGWKK